MNVKPLPILLLLSVLFSACTDRQVSIRPPLGTMPKLTYPGNALPRLVDTSLQIAMVFVDFTDGRLKDGSPPKTDADTAFFPGDAINAVGSMGWVRSDPNDPHSPLRKKIRKYHYEDYWKVYFSEGTYYDDSVHNVHPNPDYLSHGLHAYGSARDYFREVSYGRFSFEPAQTRPGGRDMYHTGIVNGIDSSMGNHDIRWIRMNNRKVSFQDDKVSMLDPVTARLDSLHHLPKDNPEYIPFDPAHYSGKYAIIGAGSNIGGATFYFNKSVALAEKYYYVPNQFPGSTLDGVLSPVHEFGHTLGLEHVVIGSFDPMHWGGVTPVAQYCPPHLNPLSKYQLGWLDAENIVFLDSSATGVTLRPSHLKPNGDIPTAAVIHLKPKAAVEKSGVGGKLQPYPGDEYLFIEYRTRDGFNRFSGGSTLPAGSEFNGGALIWHFNAHSSFPYRFTDQISNFLSLEVPGYGPDYPHGKDQSPEDYCTPGKVVGPGPSHPNTDLVNGQHTGIVIDNFRFVDGNIRFDVSYR